MRRAIDWSQAALRGEEAPAASKSCGCGAAEKQEEYPAPFHVLQNRIPRWTEHPGPSIWERTTQGSQVRPATLSAIVNRPDSAWPDVSTPAIWHQLHVDRSPQKSSHQVRRLLGTGPQRGAGYGGTAAPNTRFAINAPKFFVSEDDTYIQFGAWQDIADDLGALGAGVVRQPGKLDLLAQDILVDPTSGLYSGFPTDILSGAGPFPSIDKAKATAKIQTMVNACRSLANLSDGGHLLTLVEYLASSGQHIKIILTFLTLGGGVQPIGLTYSGGGYVYSSPLSFEWSGHGGLHLHDDYGYGHHFESPGASGTGWDERTLDPSSGYKRWFYRTLARCIGRRFVALRSSLLAKSNGEIDLKHWIAGIELGNELEVRQTRREISRREVYGDGESWGHLYFDCATALIDEASWLPVRLPGLASYGPTKVPPHGAIPMDFFWEGKVDFVNTITTQVLTDLADPTRKNDSGIAYRDIYSIIDLISGLDIHYYHRSDDERQHFALLIVDLSTIRQTLYGVDTSLEKVPISVIESSVNVCCIDPGTDVTPSSGAYDRRCEYGSAAGPATTYTDIAFISPVLDPGYSSATVQNGNQPDHRPSHWRCHKATALVASSSMGALAFQGASVWMRLAVAMAAGADIVGWHTHIANSGNTSPTQPTDFAGTGLRRDFHKVSDNPSVAWERVSWYCYQRFVALLGSSRSVEILSPIIGTHDHDFLESIIGYWGVEKGVWILEFHLGVSIELATYAYLLFLDPYGPPSAPPRCASVTLLKSWPISTPHIGIHVFSIPTEPVSFSSAGGPADFLPDDSWSTGPNVEIAFDEGPGPELSAKTFQLSSGSFPTLLFSRSRLAVYNVEAT